MNEDRSPVEEVRWRYVLPWLLLTDAPAAAARSGSLLLASVGLLATAWGVRALGWLFLGEDAPTDGWAAIPWTSQSATAVWNRVPVVEALEGLAAPWRELTSSPSTARLAFAAATLLWFLSVWALIGGALLRMAVERLGRRQPLSSWDAARHGWERWPMRMSALAMPMTVAGALFLLIVLICWPAGWSYGAWLTGLLSVLLPPLCIGMGVIVAATIAAAPLMWASLAVRRDCDGYDALGDGLAYATQRPMRYALYTLLAVALGWVGWNLVTWIGQCVDAALLTPLSWSIGQERAALMFNGTAEGLSDQLAANMLGFWRGLIAVVVSAYGWSYLWTASGGVYLLLRADLDGREWTEIPLSDESGAKLKLPPRDSSPKTTDATQAEQAESAAESTPQDARPPEPKDGDATPENHPTPP